MWLNGIEWQKVFVVKEFKLLILIHGDFSWEIYVSVKESSDDVDLALLIWEICTIQFDFEKDIFLSIKQVLLSGER